MELSLDFFRSLDFKLSDLLSLTRETSRYGMGSETPMHPSRTPLHPYMTPMRDSGGMLLWIVHWFI